MKLLDRLRDMYLYIGSSDGKEIYEKFLSNEFADDLQAEIDKYYLPRPIFEDGEPVHSGDYILTDDGEVFVDWYNVSEFGTININGSYDSPCYMFYPGDKIKRGKDTKDRLMCDVEEFADDYLGSPSADGYDVLYKLIDRAYKLGKETK